MGSQLGLSGYVAIAAVIWIVQTLYKGLTSPLRRVPGPFFSNFTRLPLKLATIGGRQLYFIHELHQRYGPVVRISPTEVSVASLDGFKEIHRVGKGFPKGEWYQKLSQNRAGVFHMRDSKAHAYRRKLFARAFSKSEIRSLWEPVIREKAQLTVSQIQAELKATGVCDVLKWATFFSTDVSGHLMFGESFEMLRLGKKTEYIRILESALKGAGIAVELPFLRAIAPYVPIKAFRGLFIPGASIAEYSQRAVTNGRKNSDSCRNIFSGLIAESEKGQSAITDADVAFEAGNLTIAGSDTTAVTLTYLIWAVLSRPALRSQLETELAGVNEDYVEADLESLPLLNAVILETLRLYGAAPGALPRTVPAGGVTLSSHYLPSGTTVNTQNWTMHRDEKFFSDPESFDPSRWLPGDNEVSELAREALAPFGAGARICLGIHIAWMELRLAVTEFFRRCENVQLAPNTTKESMKPVHYFLIAPSAHQCEVVLK